MDLFRSVIDKNKFSALTACEKSQTFRHANFAGAKLDNFLAKSFTFCTGSQCAEFVAETENLTWDSVNYILILR